MADREAAAQLGGAIQISDVIERIIAGDYLEQPVLTPDPITAQPMPQRAGPSGRNAHATPFLRRINYSDEKEPEQLVWPPRRPRLKLEEAA